MDAWMDSPGHKANILNCDFQTLGRSPLRLRRSWWTEFRLLEQPPGSAGALSGAPRDLRLSAALTYAGRMSTTQERTEEQDLPHDVFLQGPSSRGTLEHVTGRWGALTLGALYEGSFRFNELRRRVDGVSERCFGPDPARAGARPAWCTARPSPPTRPA